MDTMEVNKAVAAVLTAGIAFMGATLLSGVLVSETPLKKSAITVDTSALEASNKGAAAAPAGPPPIAPLLVSASAEEGQQLTQKLCSVCHNFNEGGTAKVGPDLYGVLGRQVASFPGFDYSTALKSKKGPWTYAELNEWLYKPAGYAPGTRMGFAGLPNNKQRADVIAYLRSLSPHPEPLPKVEPAAAAAQASPAPAPAGQAPIGPMLASADVATGQKFASQVCAVCHNFAKGQGNKVGPNLWDVVGRERASEPGFDYSAALKSKPGHWTYDTLNEWLSGPQKFAPGTRMVYPGIPKESLRIDVIAYLRTLSDHPEPLPQAAAKPAPTQAAAPSAATPAVTTSGKPVPVTAPETNGSAMVASPSNASPSHMQPTAPQTAPPAGAPAGK